ncbi:DksA/TraR family C4-type zinc finger protein, partial [Vibrio parahaemolyticus]|nr:DksA/TraR family C4-type zinc finger protein [Vibrio parahaemolyticus]
EWWDEIPEAGRVALKGVRLCIVCQSTIELGSQRQGLFNRRSSKDSKLR